MLWVKGVKSLSAQLHSDIVKMNMPVLNSSVMPHQVEQLTDTMDQIRGKMHGGQDENRTLASRVELMDK